MSDWPAAAVPLIGGLGLGSIASQYVAGGSDRRQFRAHLVAALTIVESARWVGADSTPDDMGKALRGVETAGLIARVPRQALLHYVTMAHAAQMISRQSWEDWPDEEDGGGAISSAFSDLVQESAAEITELLWHPWIKRPGLKSRLIAMDLKADGLDSSEVKQALARSRQLHGSWQR